MGGAYVVMGDDGREVWVRPLADTPTGEYAIDPDAHLVRIGVVERTHRIRDGMIRRIWLGRSARTGKEVTADTKHDCIELLVQNEGFAPTDPNSTIPDLLAGLGEDH